MRCELCGNDEAVVMAKVEGAEVSTCGQCSAYGTVIQKIAPAVPIRQSDKRHQSKEETAELLKPNYPELIRKARERRNLTQKHLALQLNEKESVMQKIESGHFEPALTLARKIEQFLHIDLVEEYKESHATIPHGPTESFTLGHFIKVKKK